jgi:GNAT superfamily N-acetyltransferase
MTVALHTPQFMFRLVLPDEALSVHALHLEVGKSLLPGQARVDTLAHFMAHTEEHGAIIASFTEKAEMIAYGVIGLHSHFTDILTDLLAIQSLDQERFCILDGAAVKLDWRGHQLHRRLIQARLQHCRQWGRSLIGVTVSPNNIVSLRSLLAEQFQIRQFRFLYGGIARFVLLRDLSAPSSHWIEDRRIHLRDVTAHQSALENGLIGFDCTLSQDGQWQIHYAAAI